MIIIMIFNIIIIENRLEFFSTLARLLALCLQCIMDFDTITGGLVTGKNSPDRTTPSILHISQSSSRSKLKSESAHHHYLPLRPDLLGNLANRLSNDISWIFYILYIWDFPSSGDWRGNTQLNISNQGLDS